MSFQNTNPRPGASLLSVAGSSSSATNARRHLLGRGRKTVGVSIGLALFVAWTLLPIVYLAVVSVKPEALILDPPSLGFRPTLERYRELLRWETLGAPIRNSLTSSILGTVGAVILGTMAALGFSLVEFRGKGLLFFAILLTRMYPPMTTLIPMYLMVRMLGLLDTVTALVVVFIALQIPLVLWIMHISLSAIPQDVVESAVLDGASFPVVVLRILLPLSTPGIVSASILSFIFCWNSFLLPFVFTSSSARTGTVAIRAFTETYSAVLWGPLSTVSIAMVAPTIVFMLALRAYLVKGLTAGMLKG